VLSGQLGIVEHLGGETEGTSAAALQLTGEDLLEVFGFGSAHRVLSDVAGTIMVARCSMVIMSGWGPIR